MGSRAKSGLAGGRGCIAKTTGETFLPRLRSVMSVYDIQWNGDGDVAACSLSPCWKEVWGKHNGRRGETGRAGPAVRNTRNGGGSRRRVYIYVEGRECEKVSLFGLYGFAPSVPYRSAADWLI